MALSMTSLLVHDETVPQRARDALRTAQLADASIRDALMVRAARILGAETGLPCEDVRELVDLSVSCR